MGVKGRRKKGIYEYAEKIVVDNFGEGLREVLENVIPLGEALQLSAPCGCYICNKSKEEWEAKKKVWDDEILALDFESFAMHVMGLYPADPEDPYGASGQDNWEYNGSDYFCYITRSGLTLEIEKHAKSFRGEAPWRTSYTYRIYPPTSNVRFMEGSSMLEVLMDIGYGHSVVKTTYKGGQYNDRL